MQSVGIKTLKNKLSEYIRAAAAGETVLVTDRGRVVAEVVPPRVHADSSAAEQRIGELIRQGLLTPPRHALSGPPPRVPVAHLNRLMKELDADRDDR